ncbi:MAG: malectin domain-containing carbohydrate-binding protein [Leptolyngbyaceae bacterium]|nr:malectin domain-containing carbohydrate-binding protein [Leptolyngbyaceae bacterium]
MVTLFRINSGGAEVPANDNGPNWSADQSASQAVNKAEIGTPSIYLTGNDDSTFGTNNPRGPGVNTTNAPDDLFSVERFGEFGYAFDVPNGNYTVNLYFDELFFTSSGQRLFDVTIEGNTVLDDFDPFNTADVLADQVADQVGGNNTFVQSFDVDVSDGQLSINFIDGVNNPHVAAVEIISNASPPTFTSASSIAVDENQTFVLDVNSTDDVDQEGSGLTYSVTGGADQAAFSINSSTGALSFQSAPDFEAPIDSDGDNVYDVEVSVTDSANLTRSQLIQVEVQDVDDTAVGGVFEQVVIRATPKGDRLSGNSLNNIIRGLGDDDVISGRQGDDFISGNQGNDVLRGNSGNDVIRGRFGDDRIIGGSGSDRLNSDRDNDFIDGGAGNDFIKGGAGRDRLNGGSGDDELLGNGKKDIINGGSGDDVIIGGFKNDVLTGGRGSDTFVYRRLGDRIDRITDFTVGEDLIDLSRMINRYNLDADTAFDTNITLRQRGSKTVVKFDRDGNGNAPNLALIRLENIAVSDLSESDFILS